MRRALYIAAVGAMVVGAVGLAFLPQLDSSWLWFALLGAFFTALGGGGWVLAGATAGDWPRPRGGWVLMLGGAVAAVAALVDGDVYALAWAAGQGLSGALLIFPVFRVRQGPMDEREPGPVQAPPSRRQSGR